MLMHDKGGHARAGLYRNRLDVRLDLTVAITILADRFRRSIMAEYRAANVVSCARLNL